MARCTLVLCFHLGKCTWRDVRIRTLILVVHNVPCSRIAMTLGTFNPGESTMAVALKARERTTSDSIKCRARALQLRQLAEDVRGDTGRRFLLEVARDYDGLAKVHETGPKAQK